MLFLFLLSAKLACSASCYTRPGTWHGKKRTFRFVMTREELSLTILLSGSKPKHGAVACFISSSEFWIPMPVAPVDNGEIPSLVGLLIDRAQDPDSKVSIGWSVYISQPLSERIFNTSNRLLLWHFLTGSLHLIVLTAADPPGTKLLATFIPGVHSSRTHGFYHSGIMDHTFPRSSSCCH